LARYQSWASSQLIELQKERALEVMSVVRASRAAAARRTLCNRRLAYDGPRLSVRLRSSPVTADGPLHLKALSHR
jgi:hypothetical protein